MSANRKSAPIPDERVVVFVCTGGQSHTKRKLGEVALREGVALEVGARLAARNTLRKGFAEIVAAREAPGVTISDFDFRCRQCGEHFQRRQETMRAEVANLFTAHPNRMRVRRDISAP